MTALITSVSLVVAVFQPRLTVEGLIADVTVWSVFPLIVLWFGPRSSRQNGAAFLVLAVILALTLFGQFSRAR